MTYHDGQLLPYFAVACGMCHDSVIKLIMNTRGIARNKTEARAVLERERWACTRAWGWICPRCDQRPANATEAELIIQHDGARAVPEVPK